MNKKKFTIHLDEDYCKGCSICASFCPMKVYEMGKRISKKGYVLVDIAHPEKCIGCRTCELMCPDLAIYIEEAENVG